MKPARRRLTYPKKLEAWSVNQSLPLARSRARPTGCEPRGRFQVLATERFVPFSSRIFAWDASAT